MSTQQYNRVIIKDNKIISETPIIPLSKIPKPTPKPKPKEQEKRKYNEKSHTLHLQKKQKISSQIIKKIPVQKRGLKNVESRNILQELHITYYKFMNDEKYFNNCIDKITKYISKFVENIDGPHKARGVRLYENYHKNAIKYTKEVFQKFDKHPDNIIFKNLLLRITKEFKNSNVIICFEIVFFYFRRHQRNSLIYELFSNIANYEKCFDVEYLDELHKKMLEKFTTDEFTNMWGKFIYPVNIQTIQDISNKYFEDLHYKIQCKRQKKLLGC